MKTSDVRLGFCQICGLCLVVSDEDRVRKHYDNQGKYHCPGSNLKASGAIIGGTVPDPPARARP